MKLSIVFLIIGLVFHWWLFAWVALGLTLLED